MSLDLTIHTEISIQPELIWQTFIACYLAGCQLSSAKDITLQTYFTGNSTICGYIAKKVTIIPQNLITSEFSTCYLLLNWILLDIWQYCKSSSEPCLISGHTKYKVNDYYLTFFVCWIQILGNLWSQVIHLARSDCCYILAYFRHLIYCPSKRRKKKLYAL